VRDLTQRAELGCGVPAPPIIRLARLVAGEAAPKERVRVFSARFKIPLRVFRLCVILERSEESRIFLFPSPEGEASGARGEVPRFMQCSHSLKKRLTTRINSSEFSISGR
jgi:hypothetical protein